MARVDEAEFDNQERASDHALLCVAFYPFLGGHSLTPGPNSDLGAYLC